jgi:hypothetical protein
VTSADAPHDAVIDENGAFRNQRHDASAGAGEVTVTSPMQPPVADSFRRKRSWQEKRSYRQSPPSAYASLATPMAYGSDCPKRSEACINDLMSAVGQFGTSGGTAMLPLKWQLRAAQRPS